MPIAKQPGAVGTARQPSNAPKPNRKYFVPPKFKAIAAITVGDTMIDPTSQKPIPINNEEIWWKDTKLASVAGGSSHAFTLLDRSTSMEPSDNEIAASQSRGVPDDDISTSYHGTSSISADEMNTSVAMAAKTHEPDEFIDPFADPKDAQLTPDEGKGRTCTDSTPDSTQEHSATRRNLGLEITSSPIQSSRWTPSDDLRAMYAAARAPPRRAPVFYDVTASARNPFVDPADQNMSVNF